MIRREAFKIKKNGPAGSLLMRENQEKKKPHLKIVL
jgi:hypothetical protein